MDYILGVDGGGTKTLAAAADTDGKINLLIQPPPEPPWRP